MFDDDDFLDLQRGLLRKEVQEGCDGCCLQGIQKPVQKCGMLMLHSYSVTPTQASAKGGCGVVSGIQKPVHKMLDEGLMTV